MLKGLLAGGITMGVAAVFPEALVFPFFGGVLGLLAGVYPGIAMAESEERRPGLHWFAAMFFLLLGMVGIWMSPGILALAWLLFGLWSLLLPVTALGDGVPEGYPGFTSSFALITASIVAFMWMAGV